MTIHESTIGTLPAVTPLLPLQVSAKPGIETQQTVNQTRPFAASDALFASQERYGAVNPRLRLKRLMSVGMDELSLYTARPTQVKDITVNVSDFIRTVKNGAVDASMLDKGIVPINVSDLDGTLWKDPIADILVYGKLCSEKKLKPVIRDKLTELLGEMKGFEIANGLERSNLEPSGLDQPDKGVNEDVLRAKAWFDANKGNFDREQLEDWSRRVYPLTSWSLAGFSVKEVQQMTRDIVRAQNLKGVAFRGARAKVITLKRAGIPTALFSASNTVLAQAAVDEIFGGNKTKLNVVGTDVRIDDNGILTTEVINGGPCFRENKLDKVKAFMRDYVAEHYPAKANQEMRPLMASGDSPSKTDEQMMEYAVYACADEPGTKRDVKIAMDRAQSTGRYFILDYLKTVGGKQADGFRVDRPLDGAAGAL